MSEASTQLLDEVRELRKLVELLAEPAIAQRDAKLRGELLKIVGSSKSKQRSVFLMDGTRTQAQIRAETSVHQGELSTMVGRLRDAKLLSGEVKLPKLAISIPPNLFETDARAK